MTIIEKLRAQADEFRAYGRAECLPARQAQWEEWADNCEQAAAALEQTDTSKLLRT